MAGSKFTIEFIPVTERLTRGFREVRRESTSTSRDLRRLSRTSLDVRDATLKVERAQISAARAADRYGRESLQAAQAQVRLERAQDRLSRASDRQGKRMGVLAAGFGKAAKAAAGLAAAYLSVSGIKSAISTTEELGKQTLTLSKSFGLTVHAASQWAAVSKARGTDGRQLVMGFKQLASQVRTARIGIRDQSAALDELRKKNDLALARAVQDAARSRDQVAAQRGLTRARRDAALAEAALTGRVATQARTFAQLGISQRDLAKHGDDLEWVIARVADGLGAMPAGTEKAAISARLFGRTWTTIAPLVRAGSRELQAQLELADKYGATLGGKTVRDVQALIQAQREQRLAWMGIQVQLGRVLIPTITTLNRAFATTANAIRTGWPHVTSAVSGGVKTARDAVRDWARKSGVDFQQIGQAFKNVATVVRAVFTPAFQFAYAVARRALPGIKQVVQGALNAIAGVIKVFSSVLTGDFGGAWKGLTRIIRGQAQMWLGLVRAFTAPLREAASAAFGGMRKAADAAFGAMRKLIAKGIAAILGYFSSLISGAAAVVRGMSKVPVIGSKFKGLADSIQGVADRIDRVRDKLNGIDRKTVRVSIEVVRRGARQLAPAIFDDPIGRALSRRGGGMVPAMVSSGEEVHYGNASWTVPGPRVAADNVMTMLPVGSAVVTSDGQAKMRAGASLVQALASQAPHFAGGGVVRGKVSVFGPPLEGAGTTASGGSSSQAGLAMNLQPGTDSGWNNPTTDRWMSMARDGRPQLFEVRIAGHRGVLPAIDKGPAGFTNRAIDVTGAGARRMGIDPARFPTDAMGTATAVGKGRAASGALSFMRQPPVVRSRLVDLQQPYGALDAFQQGFDAGVGGGRLFRTPTGLDSDLFKSAVSGVRPNTRDVPHRVKLKLGRLRGLGNLAGAGDERPLRAVRAASIIDAKGYPYSTPGDRGTSLAGPMDCSGAVSKVLINSGLMTAPVRDSTYFKGTWGRGGSGRYITTYSHGGTGASGHVFMRIGSRYFGTSGQNPGGGAGWLDSFPGGSDWTLSHFPGLRKGGVVGDPIDPGRGLTNAQRRRTRFGPPRFRVGGTVQHFQAGGRVGRLVSSIGSASVRESTTVVGQMRRLAMTLDNAEWIAYRRLGRIDANIRQDIAGLAGGGLTGTERVQVRRLRGALTLVEATMGRQLGMTVAASQRVLDAVSTNQTLVGRGLAIKGIDESSVQGLTTLTALDRNSLAAMRGERGGLRRALRRAVRRNQPEVASSIRDQIGTLDDTIGETRVSRAERRRALATMRRYQPSEVSLALSGLTADTGDDLSALRQREGLQAEDLRRARSPEETIRLAGELASTREAIKSLEQAQREAARVARYQPGDVRLALAQLTRDTGDDLSALREREALLADDLARAADPEEIINLAGELAATRSSIESLTQEQAEANRIAQERIDLDRQLAENQRRILAVAESQPNVLLGALIAAINGGIGGKVGLGFQTPMFPGRGVRY